MHNWRLIVDAPLDAAANMARDEAILRGALAGGGPTLRFYSWRPWAFSLGFFQKYADFAALAGEDTPIVRRLTGGGAIYHADELTYSLVGPAGRDGFPGRACEIFEKVHSTIVEGLRAMGVDAELSDAPGGQSADICFQRPQKLDIVVGGAKLLGSAQRRRGAHFLQHGSLPLSPNRFAPEAISLEEALAKPAVEAMIIDALGGAFEEGFHVRLVEEPLGAAEVEDARTFAAQKYGAADWNRRR